MFCSKCGKENKEGSVFCYHCGTRLVTPQMLQNQPVQSVINNPLNPQMAKPKKSKHIGTIVLVICILVLCFAIIGGIIALVVVGGKKKEKIDDFIDQVEAFEAYLDGVNYSGVQDDIVELMEDCEKAINNRSVDEFSKLEERMRTIRLKLGDISQEIDSLEQLKIDYEILIEENFVIPEDILIVLDELFENIHQDISNDNAERLEDYQEELADIVSQLEQHNQALIDETLLRAEAYGPLVATVDERETLNTYLQEIDAYIADGNYRLAFDKALMYESYVSELMGHTNSDVQENTAVSEGTYICPNSDSRYLVKADLVGLSSWELLLARNEIFARHGRKFVDENIQAYFNSQSWYNGTVDPDDFDMTVFNEYELANIDFIKAHE